VSNECLFSKDFSNATQCGKKLLSLQVYIDNEILPVATVSVGKSLFNFPTEEGFTLTDVLYMQ